MKKTGNDKNDRINKLMIIMVSLALLCLGHFIFYSGGNHDGIISGANPTGVTAVDTVDKPGSSEDFPVKHIHRTEIINGLKQEINILEIDPAAPGVTIKPVLSHDLVYGYELLSKMAEEKNAYAAVNGGFFRDYGLPAGMVVIDGELVSAATGEYPVLIVENGRAVLKEIKSSLFLEYSGGQRMTVDNINVPAEGKQTVVYTPVYGRTNRAERKNITITVENGIVTRIADYVGEARIPENGMLISFFDTGKYAGIELPIKVGDNVRLIHLPEIGKDMQAYECGSWLIKEGVPVVKEKDPWVGVMTNRDPRTAVGIKEDGTVLLFTVDGRQPGYSTGFTGQELAEYLIKCGAENAAMLDGGASTEMLVEGKLVSRPSYKGREREIAGGILVLLNR